jgi:hypothetical protein
VPDLQLSSEEQDGFEEKAHLKVEDQAQFTSDDYEEKIMAEFILSFSS